MSIKKSFADGITSLTQKLTNSRNAHSTNTITATRVYDEELRAIYRTGIGSKIMRIKSGIALNDSIDFETIADEEFYQLRLDAAVKRASKFMLAFGRGLIVLHDEGADLSKPLAKVKDYSKLRLHVFSGDMVYVQSVNLDLASPDYFKPTSYNVRGFTLHPSRCIDFSYVEPVEFDAPEYKFGGIAEFELIKNELISDSIIQRAVPAILEKSSTLFYKIEGFKELLADQKESQLVSYFQTLESLRSIYGAGLVDQEDSIETHTQALSNLAESDMITLRRLAMVTGIPLSWLVGEAATGLNSTGEGERQVLMQTIKTLQADYLLEPINRLMKLCGRERVSFKVSQGETAGSIMAVEKEAIANAQILWAIGEDHSAYLSRHNILTPDPVKEFFEIDNEA